MSPSPSSAAEMIRVFGRSETVVYVAGQSNAETGHVFGDSTYAHEVLGSGDAPRPYGSASLVIELFGDYNGRPPRK